MTAVERKKLAKIVYEFIEMRTRYNSPADGDLVANQAVTNFNEILEQFDIKEEFLAEVEGDYTTDDEDKEFLKKYAE